MQRTRAHGSFLSGARSVWWPAGTRSAGPGPFAAAARTALAAGLRRLLVPAGLAALVLTAFLVYQSSLGDYFAADDFVFLQAAERHAFGEYLRRSVTFPHAQPFDLETPFWRPLVDVYFYTWWHLFGLDPLPYHLTNVALHAGVGVLTSVLVWQLTRDRLSGLIAGTLFVVSPTHDYTVSWISDITEILAAFWYLVALIAYAAFLRRGGGSWWLYVAALSATVLSFLSKQSSVTVLVPLAGLALLIEPPADGRAWRRRAADLLPFAALAAGFLALIATQEYPRYAAIGWYRLDWHVLGHWWDYLRWLTFPITETTNESRQVRATPAMWLSHGTALAFLIVGGAAVLRRRALLGGIVLWAAVAFMPFLSATRPIEPRYAYLATVPLCIAVALLARPAVSWLDRRSRWRLGIVAALAGLMLAGLTLAGQTRERQRWMQEQAQAYETLVRQTPLLCGALPARSQIYLAADPAMWDLYHGFSGMALNLLYEDVSVAPLPAADEPTAARQGEAVCVVHYRDGRYVRPAPDFVERGGTGSLRR